MTPFAAPMNASLAQQSAINDTILKTALGEESLVLVRPGVYIMNPYHSKPCCKLKNKKKTSNTTFNRAMAYVFVNFLTGITFYVL